MGFIAGACCAASARACVRGRMGTGRYGSAGARARPGRRGVWSEEGVWSEDPEINARFAVVPLGYSSHLWRGLCCRKGRPRARRRWGRDARRPRGRGTGRGDARTHQRGGSREPLGQGHDGHAGGA